MQCQFHLLYGPLHLQLFGGVSVLVFFGLLERGQRSIQEVYTRRNHNWCLSLLYVICQQGLCSIYNQVHIFPSLPSSCLCTCRGLSCCLSHPTLNSSRWVLAFLAPSLQCWMVSLYSSWIACPCFLFMSELNQEHLVHVCMVFWSSIEVFFGVHVDNLKYFNFWVLHNTPVFASTHWQGAWSVAEACSYLFQGRGLTRTVGWQHCWSVFAQRLRNTFLQIKRNSSWEESFKTTKWTQMSLCWEVHTGAVSQPGCPPCPGWGELGWGTGAPPVCHSPVGRQGAPAWLRDTELLFSGNVIPSNSWKEWFHLQCHLLLTLVHPSA